MDILEIIMLTIGLIIVILVIIYGFVELLRKLLKKEPFWPSLKEYIMKIFDAIVNALF